MAGRLLIVVDTSYWVELFRIPKHYSETKYRAVKAKFTWAAEQNATLYWPLPCVYELANHIAHIKEGKHRFDLAGKLYHKISADHPSLIITPACAINDLQVFLKHFVDEYVQQNIGLADAAVIEEAKRLKKDHNQVHIWTLESTLKSHEPDSELAPFVW
jgi:predicted nucleic acid-binding protein